MKHGPWFWFENLVVEQKWTPMFLQHMGNFPEWSLTCLKWVKKKSITNILGRNARFCFVSLCIANLTTFSLKILFQATEDLCFSLDAENNVSFWLVSYQNGPNWTGTKYFVLYCYQDTLGFTGFALGAFPSYFGWVVLIKITDFWTPVFYK